MIDSIHIYIGKIHHHLSEEFWSAMAKEMFEKFDCDVVFKTIDESDTKFNVDGDLIIDEIFDAQLLFSKHIEKVEKG